MPAKKPLVSNPTIGADIEVFLKDKETGVIVSAEGIIRGTKYEPYRFKDGNPFFATSLDNVMAEFCIPPAQSPEDFTNNIQEALAFIESSIPKNLTIFAYPSALIDPKFLQTENAKLFGCEPDYNAWLIGQQNERPEAANSNLRSCGGHIHIGYDKSNFLTNLNLIRAMDLFVGLPSILQEPDNQRKTLYGKAGAYREKSYGAEYRTVSNYYVSSPNLMNWVFNNTQAAIAFVNSGYELQKEEIEGIQAAINFNNAELARTLCSYFGIELAS